MLDDPVKTKLIQPITIPEIETLYWKLEDHLSDGDLKKASTFFDMLCYIAHHKKDLISAGLRECHRNRLQEISYEIAGRDVPIIRKGVRSLKAIPALDIPFAKERELNDYLHANPLILSNALGVAGRITGREIEIAGYKCDITFENEGIFYAVELKKVQADHKSVSQLDKYCHFFYLKLRYNFYKQIKGVIVANGVDRWAINEFRRKDRLIYTIKPTDKKNIILEQITWQTASVTIKM